MRYLVLDEDTMARRKVTKEELVSKERTSDLATLQSIGDRLGLTKERIRQIESKGLKYLKENMERDPVFGYVDKPSVIDTYSEEFTRYI